MNENKNKYSNSNKNHDWNNINSRCYKEYGNEGPRIHGKNKNSQQWKKKSQGIINDEKQLYPITNKNRLIRKESNNSDKKASNIEKDFSKCKQSKDVEKRKSASGSRNNNYHRKNSLKGHHYQNYYSHGKGQNWRMCKDASSLVSLLEKNIEFSRLSKKQKSKYVALDCEMVGVGSDDSERSALARVSVVDWNGSVLLDNFVKVNEPVTDYRTFVSGVTKGDIESDEAIDFVLCRSIVKSIMKGKILIGHALKNDLEALKLDHPWYDTRDTAKYKPFMRYRLDKDTGTEKLCPRKLKEIVAENLGCSIQQEGQYHSPIEDSISALLLYKKERANWEKIMKYKIQKTRTIHLKQQRLDQQHRYNQEQKTEKLMTTPSIPTQVLVL